MTAPKNKPIEPGIYFNLPEDVYHADPALGSTDVRKLLMSAPDYWWGSWMNPNRPEDKDDTVARLRGRAIHKIVLEGEEPFLRLYARRADDLPDASASEKTALTKSEKARAAKEGKDLLHGADYDRAMITGAMISKNPHTADAFSLTGMGRSEVSVFWTEHVKFGDKTVPVPCKARFDKLRPRAIGDLKSIANIRGRDFPAACRYAISDWRYDIQVAHYMRGRAQVPAFIRAGKIGGGGGTKEDGEYLAAVAAAKSWAFVFVFFQSEGAPITWGTILSPENPMIAEISNRDRQFALERFVQFTRKFGTDMWVLAEPLAELDISEMPPWFAR